MSALKCFAARRIGSRLWPRHKTAIIQPHCQRQAQFVRHLVLSSSYTVRRARCRIQSTYSNLCATMLRDALKEPLKEAAKAREIVYFKNIVYENGQPVKQIMHDMTELATTADGVRGTTPAE